MADESATPFAGAPQTGDPIPQCDMCGMNCYFKQGRLYCVGCQEECPSCTCEASSGM